MLSACSPGALARHFPFSALRRRHVPVRVAAGPRGGVEAVAPLARAALDDPERRRLRDADAAAHDLGVHARLVRGPAGRARLGTGVARPRGRGRGRPGRRVCSCSDPRRRVVMASSAPVAHHKALAPSAAAVRVALVTASDSRTPDTNEGGQLLRRLIEEAGFSVTSDDLLAEEPAALRDAVARLARDSRRRHRHGRHRHRAARSHARCRGALFDRRLPGFGELFRMLSFQEIGPAAMLSRADAGVVGSALVFLLPGSPAAVELAVRRLIAPELTHAVGQLRRVSAHQQPCIMSAEAATSVSSPERLVDPQARVIDYLRVSVTDRCNYGCSYCIPARRRRARGARRRAVVRGDRRAGARVRRRSACAASASPAASRPCAATCRRSCACCARIPGIDDIALSTNGHLLAELAAPLRAAGVDRVNISLDSLDPERFRRITRRGDLARVLAGIEAARAAGFASIKLNTVAIARLQRRRIRPHLRLGLGARAGAALHRGDADGGRARLPARRARCRPPRSAAASPPPGRARAVVADDGGRRRARRRSGALLPSRSGTTARRRRRRAPVRDHLADDRALLRRPATGCGCRRSGALHACLGVRRRGRPARAAARGRRRRGRRRDSRRRSRANGPGTPSSSSGSAVRARRWYKSADDRRRAAQAAYRRPGARVRGTAGRAVRDPQRQHGSGPPRRDGRVREAGRRHCCARRARSVDIIDTGGFPMVVGRFIQDPSFPTVTVYNHLDVQPADGEGWRTPPFKLTRDASGAAGPRAGSRAARPTTRGRR